VLVVVVGRCCWSLCGMLVVGRCCRLRSVLFSADAVSVATMSDTVQNQILRSSHGYLNTMFMSPGLPKNFWYLYLMNCTRLYTILLLAYTSVANHHDATDRRAVERGLIIHDDQPLVDER
jgi:hypothetical protein